MNNETEQKKIDDAWDKLLESEEGELLIQDLLEEAMEEEKTDADDFLKIRKNKF